MSPIAKLDHSTLGWMLQFDGSSHTYAELEEGIEEARRLLRLAGGGEIRIGSGPGRTSDRIVVAGPEPRPPTPPPSPAPSPPPMPPAAAPRREATVSEPRSATGTAVDIQALCAAYRAAGASIKAFLDPVEREVGLGTLRLEASHTLKQLSSASTKATDDDLKPLRRCVAEIEGGKGAELTVKGVDRVTKKVLKDVGHSLIATKAVGSVSVIAVVLAWYLNWFQSLGASAASLVIVGGAGLLMRIGGTTGTLGARVGAAAERWAAQLGTESDRAMDTAREIEQRLWIAHFDEPWTYVPLTSKARARADRIVTLGWIAISAAVTAFVLGFGIAIVNALPSSAPTETGTPLTP